MNRITINRLTGLILTVYAFTANAQEAMEWKLGKVNSSVNFTINHFFSEVDGKFTVFDGEFRFDPDNLEGSGAEFSVSVESIDTGNKKRDKHLMNEAYFDARNYPEIMFNSTRIEKKSDTEFLEYGQLTMKGQTKQLVLSMVSTGKKEYPSNKGTINLGLGVETSFDRNDYGVGTTSGAAKMLLGDEVRVNITLELNRKM